MGKPLCRSHLGVEEDGSLTALLSSRAASGGGHASRFPVHWDKIPEAGFHLKNVSFERVFTDVPVSAAEALAELKIAAHVRDDCTGNGEVQACGADVFRVGGKYFRNLKSEVQLEHSTFRNPPVF